MMVLSTWYEMYTFLKCSDDESEHTNGKLRIIGIHLCKFYDLLTPNGLCAMTGRSLLIYRNGPDGQTVEKDEKTDILNIF
jgi:hypothetical protein